MAAVRSVPATGGRVVRVDGPLVEVEGVEQAAMLEVLELGGAGLGAEVVSIDGTRLTLQAYEHTGGLRVGDPARRASGPLSARLGPGLLGRTFDGLLRPLSSAPVWLAPRSVSDARDVDERWAFTPAVASGDVVGPGGLLGTVPDAGPLEHRVLAPVGGRVEVLRGGPGRPAYDVRGGDVVARVGGADVRLVEHWPVRVPRPAAARLDDVVPLHTGQRVVDLLFPLARGSTAGVPGGFGTGKTVLLQQIAKWCEADVIVYVGCGERGNEMADVLTDLAELTDPRTGGHLLDRTVVIANTSNMPMMAREASVFTGVTVAEYYRDMGYDAVVIADSTSRWAEALRELASRTGALPAEEGYPADLSSALAAFYQRAGRVRTLGGATASVSVVGAISPPGGDLTEPVTTSTQRLVQTVWSLDRDLAYARHYPAVSWSGSFSRDAEQVAVWNAREGDVTWAAARARALDLLSQAGRVAALAEMVGVEVLPADERWALVAGRLLRDAVLAQSALSTTDASCSADRASGLLALVLAVVEAGRRAVERGVPAADLERLDLGAVVRAREEVPDDALTALHDATVGRIDALAAQVTP